MRHFRTIALLLSVALVFGSCEKDDDDPNEGPTYNFQEQPLQGVVGGESWIHRDGRAIVSASDSSEYLFELWAEEQDSIDYCDPFFNVEGNYIYFSMPLEEGLHTLGFDQDRTVTIWNGDSAAESVASEGAIEITNIFVTDSVTTVFGRVDARVDDENHVNGDFETVIICD